MIKVGGQERSDRGIKIAGAPISWGVCEVPGWGYQLHRDRVLTEMRGAGLTATELGPDGFLPADPAELTEVLDAQSLSCVGGFVPVVLHDANHDPARDVEGPLASLRAAGAGVVVLAAATGPTVTIRVPNSTPASGPRCWRISTGCRVSPPRPDCLRCCTRMSAPWSRRGRMWIGCWPDRRSRCVWTPVTC